MQYKDEGELVPDLEPVTVRITLKEHLAKLEAAEALNPPGQRRSVPSLSELAEAVGITRQGMYNIAGGNIKMINLEILSELINEFRRRGFSADVSDLLTAYPESLVDNDAE